MRIEIDVEPWQIDVAEQLAKHLASDKEQPSAADVLSAAARIGINEMRQGTGFGRIPVWGKHDTNRN